MGGREARDLFLRHTSQLGEGELREVRDLLDDAFAGEFGDEDFEHALWGGEIGVLGPEGPERLADEEGSTYVWVPGGGVRPDPAAGALHFDWRDGDVL